MSVSQVMSISTPSGEAAILSFTAERMKQENNTITLLDSDGKEAATITLAEDSTHRIL